MNSNMEIITPPLGLDNEPAPEEDAGSIALSEERYSISNVTTPYFAGVRKKPSSERSFSI